MDENTRELGRYVEPTENNFRAQSDFRAQSVFFSSNSVCIDRLQDTEHSPQQSMVSTLPLRLRVFKYPQKSRLSSQNLAAFSPRKAQSARKCFRVGWKPWKIHCLALKPTEIHPQSLIFTRIQRSPNAQRLIWNVTRKFRFGYKFWRFWRLKAHNTEDMDCLSSTAYTVPNVSPELI